MFHQRPYEVNRYFGGFSSCLLASKQLLTKQLKYVWLFENQVMPGRDINKY